ncbi:Galactose-binding domain-like protein [Purpureocillium lavendulum]|uniref:Galactose-binding domain-like protein n=1 Tax=Purpureocillium lavendulum TaxID=1247861 RepID=A0AB34FGE3_9HYPO|nr:Galactose-binding domain-like protein [Purpureocillium lavendulum]
MTLYATLPHGFKVSTHIYLGQELINDLKTCSQKNGFDCVNIIDNNGQVHPTQIRTTVAEAITANEKTFLTGTLGPDAFADILSGQLIIHPGLFNEDDGTITGFGTGDWVDHLIRNAQSPEELAFAMGFAGHAAADVFAHSYVNQFAGDVYELRDGEIDVETRHMMVETYISEHNPRLKDHNGQELGMMYQYLGEGSNVYAPIDFIRRILVANDVANQELGRRKGGALLRGLNKITTELTNSLYKKDYAFDIEATVRKYIASSSTLKPLTEWLAETRRELEGAGIVQQLEIIILQSVAYYWAGVQLDANEAALAAELTNKLSNLLGKSGREIINAKDEIDGLMNKVVESHNQQVLAGIETVQSFHKHLANVFQNYLVAEQYVADFGRKVTETKDVYETLLAEKACDVIQQCPDIVKVIPPSQLVAKTCEETKRVTNRVCKDVFVGFAPHCEVFKKLGFLKKHCKDVKKFQNRCEDLAKDVTRKWDCSFVKEWTETLTQPDLPCRAARDACHVTLQVLRAKQEFANKAYNEAVRIHTGTLETLANEDKIVQDSLKAFYDATVYLQSIERQARQAIQSFTSNQLELVRKSLLDLRAHVEEWRDQSIAATNDWISANAQAMLNSVSADKDNVGVAGPIMDWLKCRLPTVVLPIPVAATESICEPLRLVKRIHGEIARIENDVIKSLAGAQFPFISDVAAAFLRFKESAPYIASSLIQNIAEEAIPTDSQQPDMSLLHHAFTSKHSDTKRNEQFARDSTAKHLITFPVQKLTGTIIDHMRVDMGLTGSDDHEPFAVQNFNPARNALQLMKLSLLGGSDLNAFTKAMNYPNPLFNDSLTNLLSPWLRSIDGNHQWLPVAPAYLRKEALADWQWKSSYCPKEHDDVRRRFQKEPLPLYSDEDAKRLIFNRIFKGPLSISLENNTGGFPDLRPRDYMYKPTPDNSFPNIQPVGVLCSEGGAAFTGPESSIIYNSDTYALGVGHAWDANDSELFNTNSEPFVGSMHQRALIKCRNYWGAASYNFDTDWGVNFDFSNARTLKLSAASRSGPHQLIIQLYGEQQQTAKLAVDVDRLYNVYVFEIADFKQPDFNFDFSKVKGIIFAISEEHSDVTIDVDSIQVHK